MLKLYIILMLTSNLTWIYSTQLQQQTSQAQTTITLPVAYQNLQLEKCPPSHLEKQFAKHFPGIIETYQHPTGLIIFRQVTGATRKLHNSRTCLKSGGFTLSPPSTETDTKGITWQTYTAENTQAKFTVRSTILSPSDAKNWPTVEKWFWDAFLTTSEKTYLAITEINQY